MTDTTTQQQPAPEALSGERLADLRHYWYAVPSRGAEPARTICALLDHIANRDQEIERLRAALAAPSAKPEPRPQCKAVLRCESEKVECGHPSVDGTYCEMHVRPSAAGAGSGEGA